MKGWLLALRILLVFVLVFGRARAEEEEVGGVVEEDLLPSSVEEVSEELEKGEIETSSTTTETTSSTASSTSVGTTEATTTEVPESSTVNKPIHIVTSVPLLHNGKKYFIPPSFQKHVQFMLESADEAIKQRKRAIEATTTTTVKPTTTTATTTTTTTTTKRPLPPPPPLETIHAIIKDIEQKRMKELMKRQQATSTTTTTTTPATTTTEVATTTTTDSTTQPGPPVPFPVVPPHTSQLTTGGQSRLFWSWFSSQDELPPVPATPLVDENGVKFILHPVSEPGAGGSFYECPYAGLSQPQQQQHQMHPPQPQQKRSWFFF